MAGSSPTVLTENMEIRLLSIHNRVSYRLAGIQNPKKSVLVGNLLGMYFPPIILESSPVTVFRATELNSSLSYANGRGIV